MAKRMTYACYDIGPQGDAWIAREMDQLMHEISEHFRKHLAFERYLQERGLDG